jgi:ribonuclease HI
MVDMVFRTCTTEEVLHSAGIARRLWLRRNEVVHRGPFLDPNILVQRARIAMEEFVGLVKVNKITGGQTRVDEVQKWSVPSPG